MSARTAGRALAGLLGLAACLVSGCGYGVVAATVALVAGDDGGGTRVLATTGDARIDIASAPEARFRGSEATLPLTLAGGTTDLFVELLSPTRAAATIASVSGGAGATLGAGKGRVTGIGTAAAPPALAGGAAAAATSAVTAGADIAITLVCDAGADVPLPARIVYRVTPLSPAGPGRPIDSIPLVVGDSPPLLLLAAPTPGALVVGVAGVELRVVDEEEDPVDLTLGVEVDGGAEEPLALAVAASVTALPARPAREGGLLATYAWASPAQVPLRGRARILVRADDRNQATADPAVETTVDVDNTSVPDDVLVSVPRRSRAPDVPVAVEAAPGIEEVLVLHVAPTAASGAPATLRVDAGGTLVGPGRVALSGGPLALVWRSEADLGGPRRDVRLRVVPFSEGGPGRPTETPPLTVGDSPPLVQVLAPTPSAAVAGDVGISLRLIDAEGDPLDLAAEVEIGGARAPLATAAGTALRGLAAEPAPGAPFAFAWTSRAQVAERARARILVTPGDGSAETSETTVEVTVDVDNEAAVGDALVSLPARERGALVSAAVTLAAGTAALEVSFGAPGGASGPATLLAVSGGGGARLGAAGEVVSITAAAPTTLALTWDAGRDLGYVPGAGSAVGALLRVRPRGEDGGLGRVATSAPAILGDTPPLVSIEAPAAGSVVSGEVALSLRLIDAEGDPVALALSALVGPLEAPLAFAGPPPAPLEAASPSPGRLLGLVWATPALVSAAAQVRVRVAPDDGNPATSEASVEAAVEVDNRPGVGAALVAAPARSRSPDVPVDVTVAPGTTSLDCTYVTATAARATVVATTLGTIEAGTGRVVLAAPSTATALRLTWASAQDLGGPRAGVRFRVEPRGAAGPGPAASTAPLTVGDSAPILHFEAPTPSATVSGGVPVVLRAIDAESDPLDLALEVEVAGGARAPLARSGGPLTGIAASPEGIDVPVVWTSPAQVDGAAQARIIAVPSDGNPATLEAPAEVTVEVDNRQPLLAPEVGVAARVRSTLVPVALTLSAGTTDALVAFVTGTAAPATLLSAEGAGATLTAERGRIASITTTAGAPARVTLLWDAGADLGAAGVGVRLRVTPANGLGFGPATTTGPLTVGDRPPLVLFLAPAPSAAVRGVAAIRLLLADEERDPVSLTLTAEVAGARLPLTLEGAPSSLPEEPTAPLEQGGRVREVAWRSEAEVPQSGRARVLVEVEDGNPATAEVPAEVTVDVDNTLVGPAQASAPARSRSPDVPIVVTVSAGTTGLRVRFEAGALAGPASVTGVSGAGAAAGAEPGRIAGIDAPDAPAVVRFLWRAAADAGAPSVVGARLLVTPEGPAGLGATVTAGPVTAGDTAPLVSFARPSAGEAVSGLVTLELRLADAESDPLDVTSLRFDAPSGVSGTVLLALAQDLTGLGTAPGAGRTLTLAWLSGSQLAGDAAGVTLAAAIDDGNPATNETSAMVTVDVRNNARPVATLLEDVGTGDERFKIGIDVSIADAEADPAHLLLQWTREGEPFPALPATIADPAARAALLASAAERAALRIMTEAQRGARGRVAPPGLLGDGRSLRAVEVAAQAPLDTLAGAPLALVSETVTARPLAGAPADAAAVLYEGAGASALVLRAGGSLERIGGLAASQGPSVPAPPAGVIATGLGAPVALSLSPDGARAAVADPSAEGGRVWRVSLAGGGAPEVVARGVTGVAGVAWAPGERAVLASVATATGAPASAVVLVPAGDAASLAGRAARTLARDLDAPGPVALLPGGDEALVLERAGRRRLLRIRADLAAAAPRVVTAFAGAAAPAGLSLGSGRTALVAFSSGGPGGHGIVEVDLASGESFALGSSGGAAVAAAARADGLAVLVASAEGVVEVERPGASRVIGRIEAAAADGTITLEGPPAPGLVTAGAAVEARLGLEERPLRTSVAGTTHRFVWDSARDLVSAGARIRFRATPVSPSRGPGFAGASFLARTLRNDEPTPPGPLADFGAGAPSFTVMDVSVADIRGDGRLEVVTIIDADDSREGTPSFPATRTIALDPAGRASRALRIGPYPFVDPSYYVFAAGHDSVRALVADLGAGDAEGAGRNGVAFLSEGIVIDTGDGAAARQTEVLDVQIPSGTAGFARAGPAGGQVLGRATVSDAAFESAGRHGIVAADLDGDGRCDLVLAENPSAAISAGLPRVSVILQGATGTASDGPRLAIAPGLAAKHVAAGDIDGDGRVDLVAGARAGSSGFNSGSHYALLQTGPLAFTAIEIATSAPAERLFAADLDGDGRAEVVAIEAELGATSGSVRVYAFDGAGAAATPRLVHAVSLSPRPLDLAVADLNADGRRDVVVTRATGSGRGLASFLVQERGGGFLAPVSVIAPASELGQEGLSRPAAGDIDDDGRAEVVLVAAGGVSTGGLRLLGIDGEGALAPPRTFAPASLAGARPRIGDVNGDGRLDVVVPALQESELRAFLQGPDGSLDEEPETSSLVGRPDDLALGDVDGDGRADAVVVQRAELIAGDGDFTLVSGGAGLFLGDGAGGFAFAAALGGAGGTPEAIKAPVVAAIGDVNGDGRADVVIGEGFFFDLGEGAGADARLLVVTRTAGGFAAPRALVANGEGATWTRVRIVDVDADGLLDVVALRRFGVEASTSDVHEGDGGGRVHVFAARDAQGELLAAAGEVLDLGLVPDGGGGELEQPLFDAAAADLDGDGRAELVIAYDHDPAAPFSPGRVAVVRRLAGGGFAAPEPLDLPEAGAGDEPAPYFALEVGDLDGDGRTDVVALDRFEVTGGAEAGTYRRGARIAYGRAGGGFTASARLEVTDLGALEGAAVADVTGDGGADLIIGVTSPSSRQLVIYEQR